MEIYQIDNSSKNIILTNGILLGHDCSVKNWENLLDQSIRIRNILIDNLWILNKHEINKLGNNISLVCVHDNVHDDSNKLFIKLGLFSV